MAYVYFNPNPAGRRVGDCAVRAVAAALDTDWEDAFGLIAAAAYRKAMEGKFADLRLDVWPTLDLEKETYKLDAQHL